MTEEQPELDEETRRIVEERLTTVDEDAKDAVDAREVFAEMRQILRLSRKPGRPRTSDLSH